jgi:hypothetical protein
MLTHQAAPAAAALQLLASSLPPLAGRARLRRAAVAGALLAIRFPVTYVGNICLLRGYRHADRK